VEHLIVIAFYKFVPLPDFEELQAIWLQQCLETGLMGSILLASEGVNGMLAGSREQIDDIVDWLRSDARLNDLETKESLVDAMPFRRMKVRLKPEIVALKVPNIDPRAKVGTYVNPEAWNELISGSDVRVIDTRNDFEVEIGSFKGAENPNTEHFSDFPAYVEEHLDPAKDKKIAMFCTGGIRCEKATSYLLEKGFEEVYHLQGGILKYLETMPQDESLWEGECFVFDNRVTLDHNLQPGSYELCHSCWQPLNDVMKSQTTYEKGISCPRCADKLTPQMRASRQERMKQMTLAAERNRRIES
jgi:UPF0176 protein